VVPGSAFEAIAGHLGIARLVPADSPYAALGSSPTGFDWAVLALTGVGLAVAAYLVLRRRAR